MTTSRTPPSEESVSLFGPHARVALRQYLFEGERLVCRELGLGQVVRPPRVGDRLEIRIRGERGLASSPIRELELLDEVRLAAVTHGRVYLLSRLDLGAGPIVPEPVIERIVELLDLPRTAASEAVQVTQYMRISTDLAEVGSHPLVGVPVQIDRWQIDDAASKKDSLGVGRLLDAPRLGESLRFLDANGHLQSTSAICAVEHVEDRLVVETENRRYRLTQAPGGDGV